MHHINTGLTEEQREGVIDILQAVLSDESLLYVRTRNYHWNVTGPRFHTLHVFLEEQYKEIELKADEVAERVRQVGGFPVGTMEEFTKLGHLKEKPGDRPPAEQMIADLVADHEHIVRELREDLEECQDKYEDAGTADFLTGLMEDHEQMAWMLRAHLEDDGRQK
ncbi:MAG: DNA starvation/stationary phase protection protein [Verrucomicrobia bacterium]|nr:DNA starvation/stationary phase protection protein [Verrucomicrobiota bacterium]